MHVRRLLTVNIATLAVLGTLLLGMGRGSAWLPVGTVCAAIAAVWLTDITGRVRLSARAVNVRIVTAGRLPYGRRTGAGRAMRRGIIIEGVSRLRDIG